MEHVRGDRAWVARGVTPTTLPPLKGNQRAASDPSAHVWLSASAGTGKTQVLAARVYRLLLRGVDPCAILCLTFTKAGAAEMAGRIGVRLAQWVRMPIEDLARDLRALGEEVTPERLQIARTLFASVLDARGGGLRIQTIHSFCQSLLSAFPVEAGLTPGFRPLEGREEAMLAREALAEMLLGEERIGRARLIDAIGALSVRMGEGGAEGFLRECARAPAAMDALPNGIQPWLRRALDLPEGELGELIEGWCHDDVFDCAALHRLADASTAWGTKNGLERAGLIRDWLESDPAARAKALDRLHRVWAKSDGDLRSFGKGQAPQIDGYADDAAALYDAVGDLLNMVERAAYADLLAGALEAGRDYAATYARAKRRIGAVDFDDLIDRTVALLRQPGMGDWVRYKLDLATEHVLIDEAQDTNPRQWAIVRAITDEFFAGEGARAGTQRTLFTVGDYKQAIFSFQGSDPAFFAAAHAHFDGQARISPDYETPGRSLDTLSLTHSFRSTRPILEFVDAALAALPVPGMGALSDVEPHASEVKGPGTVTLWPPVIEGPTDAEEEGWIDDATRRLAGDIARAVRGWIGTLRLDSKGRTLKPEDVMILVKRRGDLASLIVARLYAEGVPVAGIDRLRLNAPLAVQDLLAAVRFALQPDDDLSLASLLVSPLIGWSQDDLMAGAIREGGSLWRHLRANQPEERLAPLRQLLNRADFTTPYRFLEEILSGALDGRRKLLLRLGEEARDPIEELLNAALTFEATSTPSLQRFLDWFDRGEVDIKRDPSQPSNAVRVMTAHGAKGLQAPLVLLADATLDPADAPRRTLAWAPEGHDEPFPLFRPRATERVNSPLDAVVADADRKELEEHWRLFYVAATRAEERLVIAGALSARRKGVPPPTSWYTASAAALDALGVPVGEGERVFEGVTRQPPVAPKPAPLTADHAVALPHWAQTPAPQEARPPRPLAPSAIGEDEVADPPPTPAMRAAAERGRLLHALFERLPGIAPERRSAAADRWLERSGGVADEGVRREIAHAACGIIADPHFAEVFAPDALAEAPIAATVGGVVVAGSVDRLLVTADCVRVIDFKTGRRTPDTAADIPPYHLRQMAAYAAALRVIFPGRAVEAALLYTAGPTLFALTDDQLAPFAPA
jgi:ATP-dependent helicase/nuclease subunit A